jgi:putative MFS transporter
MPIASPGARGSVAARLDRLPLSRFHRRFITLIALGAWFDLYDLFMMAYIGAALQDSRFLNLTQFTEVIAASFAGMFVGTLVLGFASDRYGRRISFLFMLALYSVFTLAGALAATPHMLMAMRFFAGIGVGAELVIIDTYVAEVTPRHARGRYLAIAHLIGFSAVPAAALFSIALVPTHWLLDGWRWVMIIGSAGALIAWRLRRNLPESPRWLESMGRHEEADRILRQIEQDVRSETDLELPEPVFAPPVSRKAPLSELFHAPYLGRTACWRRFICFKPSACTDSQTGRRRSCSNRERTSATRSCTVL